MRVCSQLRPGEKQGREYYFLLKKEFQGQKVNAALYNLRTMKLETFIDSRMAWGGEEIQEAFLKWPGRAVRLLGVGGHFVSEEVESEDEEEETILGEERRYPGTIP